MQKQYQGRLTDYVGNLRPKSPCFNPRWDRCQKRISLGIFKHRVSQPLGVKLEGLESFFQGSGFFIQIHLCVLCEVTSDVSSEKMKFLKFLDKFL